MKLSQLIREGARLIPQQQYSGYYHREQGRITSTCAIGGAFVALFGEEAATSEEIYLITKLSAALGIQDAQYVPHPVTGVVREVFAQAEQLNDIDRWSREDIADYLDQYGY